MDIRAGLTAILVLAPIGGAILCAVLGASRAIRSTIVLATGAILVVSSLGLMPLVPFRLAAESFVGLNLHTLIQTADAILLLIILYYGFKHRHVAIIALAILQLLLTSYLEFFM